MAHRPTEITRAQVLALVGFGIRAEEIADYLGITRPTLDKYYKKELSTGALRANAAIAETLYKKAKDGDTTACIFWLKTRAGWRETNKLELAGSEEQPLTIKTHYDLGKLSDDELMALRELSVKANANRNKENK